jgi:serine/threonine protein kinase
MLASVPLNFDNALRLHTQIPLLVRSNHIRCLVLNTNRSSKVLNFYYFAVDNPDSLPAADEDSLPLRLNLNVDFETVPLLASVGFSSRTMGSSPKPLTGMEDADDEVTMGQKRETMLEEKRQAVLDDDLPLFANRTGVPAKAAVESSSEIQDRPDGTDAALLLALQTPTGEQSASNGLKRVRDLYHLLSDAEKALFFQEVNGLTSTKSKKSKKSEAPLETKSETTSTKKSSAAGRARPYPYPDAIRTRALEFIEGRRGSGKHTEYEAKHYMPALLQTWASWSVAHPPPCPTQIRRWMRDAKERKVVIKTYAAAIIKWQAEFNGKAVPTVLSCIVCGIASILHRDHEHEKILLLAQLNKSTHKQLMELSEYETAKALAVMQRPDLDTQLLLKQFALSKKGKEPNGDAEDKPIEFLFAETPNLRKYQEEQLTADHRLSLQNMLKEPSPFLEDEQHQVLYLGSGTFGIVLAIGSLKNGVALKISKDLYEMDSVPAANCNEFAMHMINTNLHKSTTRTSLRKDLPQPFGPLPVSEDRQFGPWKDHSCCAMSSILHPGWGYSVLVTRRALGSMEHETEMISMHCFSQIKAQNDGFIRAASLALGAVSCIASMHSLGLCHRDIKPGNTLFYKNSSGTVNHCHTDANGRSVIMVLTDFGKSLSFATKVSPGTASVAATTAPTPGHGPSRARKIAIVNGISFDERLKKAAVLGNVIAKEMDELQRRPAENVWEVSKKYYPLSIGRDDGLREVQVRSVHVINSCFPSSLKVDSEKSACKSEPSLPPIQKQTGWGTSAFAPPEPQPSLRNGMEHLEAVDFQSGDLFALGIWLAEMLAGNGLKLGLTTGPGCNDGSRALKAIFADCSDNVFWSRFLGKELINGAIPEEYSDFVDFIRRLTRLNPADRISAKEALEHPFIALAPRIINLGAMRFTSTGRRAQKSRKP